MTNPGKDGQAASAATLVNPAGNLLGIACVLGAVVTFTTQDMAIKWLSGDYPLHEIIFARSVVGLALILSVLVPLEGGYRILRTKRLALHLLRGLAVVIATMTFFTGLATLPLGERVGGRRWFAILLGLGGVAVMLRPGSGGFHSAFLLPLAAALAYALVQIMTRKLGMAEKASTMAFYIQLTFVVVSSAIGLTLGDGMLAVRGNPSLEFLLRAWVWPSTGDAMIMLTIGCMSGLAEYLISQAYRISEASLVAPFEYAALPLAVFWSVFLWGDWPDPISWLGIALIAGAGFYAFYRETVRGSKIVLRRPIFHNR